MPVPTDPNHVMFDGIRARMRKLGNYQRGVLRAVLQMVCKKRVRCVCIGVGYDDRGRTSRHWYYKHFPGWRKSAGRIAATGITNPRELKAKEDVPLLVDICESVSKITKVVIRPFTKATTSGAWKAHRESER